MTGRIIKTIKDWLPMVILLAIPVICVIAMAVIGNDHDDSGTPGWANDVADALEENGGRIYVYREYGDNNSSYYVDVLATDVTTDCKVIADQTGFTVVFANGNVAHVPYDRVSHIYITGAT